MNRASALRLRRFPLLLFLFGALVSTARADVAHLRNGRTIDVSGFRLEGERIVLLMDGGGEMTLPSAQVLTIERSAEENASPAAREQTPSGPSGERLVAPADRISPPPRVEAPQGQAPLVVPSGSPADRATVRDLATRTARKYGVDERLVLAVIEVESRYDAYAVSPRGAMGLIQLMPQTAARFAVRNPYDPSENVDAGVRYLKELLDRYSGQPRLALAAYNAGEDAVEHFSGIPPFQETIRYVERVLRVVAR